MKKSVRMILVSLFAVSFSLSAMADGKNVTGKLWNLDCQSGMSGWNITFTTPDNSGTGYIWKTSNHTEATGDYGYYNFDAQCIELWGQSTEDPMGEATISQYATGLENGTYVFGAWLVATIQMNDSVRDSRGWEEDYASNVQGVTIFANGNSTAAQTNNPSTSVDTGHAWKFNVAATVTDGKLTVGLKNSAESNANFICMDNATLYFFGDASEADALAEMATIDFNLDKAAADTLKAYPMAKDSLDAIDAAADHVGLRLAMKKAKKSIDDYKALVNAVENAKEVLAQEWSEYVAGDVENLTAALAEAETVLATGPYNRDELKEFVDDFTNKINLVKIDELYTVKDAFDQFLNAPDEISADNPNMLCGDFAAGFESEIGEVGKYPTSQREALEALFAEVEEALTAIDAGEMSASEGVGYIDKIKNAVEACIAAINKEPTLPLDVIFIPDPNDATKAYVSPDAAGAQTSNSYMQQYKSSENGYDCFRYQSPLITLPYQIDRLVMTVIHTAYNDRSVNSSTDGPYFNISEFYLYDADGNEIELVGSDFTSNAKESSEGSYDGLVDRDINTFFHSAWSGQAKPTEFYHNLSVAMPEGLMNFSIGIEVIWGDSRLYNMPTEVIFSGTSNAQSDLQAAIDDASSYGIIPGDEPGFFTGDFTTFLNAIAAAKAVKENSESTDEEMYAAIDALDAASEGIDEAKWNLPKPGVVYQVSNQAPFVKNQGKVKNLTVLQDSIMWWADADPADEYQNFTFEQVEGPDEEEIYFAIKNVKTGKYVGEFTNDPGLEGESDIEWGNPYYVKLSDAPVALRARLLGNGQLHFWSYCSADDSWLGFHGCNHNGGTASTGVGSQGGGKGGEHPDGFSIQGVCGPIVQWEDGIGSASAWYVRQMEELPLSILTEGDFAKTPHHIYTPVQTMSFTSDEACDFADFTITNILGEPINCTVEKNGYSAIVTFEEYVESFYFNFNNVEGIKKVTVTGGVADKPAVAILQEAYDAAVAANYTEGNDIGNAKDLTAFNAALKAAELLLENGATDDEYKLAAKAIEDAIAGIETVNPVEGVQYYIVSAYDEFVNRYGAEMAIYADPATGQPGWTYINLESDNYLWEFVPATPEGFYIKNVGTGEYIGTGGSPIAMSASTDGTVPFVIQAFGDGKLNIVDAITKSSDDMLHALNHGNGGNVFGGLCYYRNEDITKSVWYIREANGVRTNIDVISVEPEVENRVLGIFDMTGRKVENPAGGLYIINGQKVLVK